MSSVTFHTNPAINAAVLYEKLDRPYRLYWLLKGIVEPERGIIDLEAVAAMAEWGDLPSVRLSTLYKLLAAGDGVFWTREVRRNVKVIRLHGIGQVAKALKVIRISSYNVEMDSAYLDGVAKFRGFLLSTVFPTEDRKGAHPRSDASVTVQTGMSRTSQWRYFGSKSKKALRDAKRRRIVRTYSNKGQELAEYEGKTAIYTDRKRLPNLRKNTLAVTPFTKKARRINRELSQSRLTAKQPTTVERRYFESMKAAVKCKNRADEVYVRTRPQNKIVRGRNEWTPFDVMAHQQRAEERTLWDTVKESVMAPEAGAALEELKKRLEARKNASLQAPCVLTDTRLAPWGIADIIGQSQDKVVS